MHKVNPRTKLCFSVIVLCLLNIVTVTTLSSNVAKAESASSTASITVPEACTMTSHNDAPHTATLSPNTYSGASGSEYQNGIGKTTLTAICNDYNGFAIYAIGFTGNSYDSENHTKLVGSNTNGTIATKAYQSGDTVSNWSMKLTKVTNTSESYNPGNLTITNSYNDWNVIPATYTKVAEYHANTGSSTTDTTLGAKVETTYAAYIASNQPADTYIGQVKYTMVHPYDNTPKDGPIADCPANKICYSPNANDIEGTMGRQSITSSTTGATLLASNFSRKGYGFAGWSDRYDYSNDNGAKFYGPQETISFTAGQYNTTNGGLRLYAIWIPSQGSLQDQSKVASVCNSLTTAPTDGTANLNSVSALTDQRDNDTYAIAKLADGKCWMIENLRLDNTAAHNSDGSLAQGYGTSATYGNFSGLADAENENFTVTNPPVANSLYSPSIDGDKTVIGTNNYSYARMPRYNNYNHKANSNDRPINPTTNSATNSTTNANMYSYGNYYTWAAAIADTTYYNAGNRSITNTSLCPKGWHLPTGGTAYAAGNTSGVNVTGDVTTFREFYNLGYIIMNGTTAYEDKPNSGQSYYSDDTTNISGDTATKVFRKYPNNFLYSGSFRTSSISGVGGSGYYWSSTVFSSNGSHNLLLGNPNVYTGTTYAYGSYGYSIRCIANS